MHAAQFGAAVQDRKHLAGIEQTSRIGLALADELAALERSTGRHVSPIFQYRFGHGLQKLKLLVDAGVLYKKRGIGMFVAEGARSTIVATRRDQFQREYVQPLVAEAAKLGITNTQLADMIQREGTQ